MNISNAFITTPFDHHTDFTELASNCENYGEAIVEETDPVAKAALCGRLSTCLSLLRPTLLDPIPAHLVDYLTVDSHPLYEPLFDPEPVELCRYCEEITHLLISGALAPHAASVMEDLLCELTTFFADRLKAPRWVRSESGLNPIN